MPYESFFNGVACGLLVCKNDQYSTIIEANDAFYDMVGYTKEEIWELYQNRFAGLVLDDLEEILKKVERAVNERHILDYEYRVMHKSGEILWVHDVATYHQESDTFNVVIMDISYKAKALEEKDRITDLQDKQLQLFAMMTHELRTPLNVINGAATMLEVEFGANPLVGQYIQQKTGIIYKHIYKLKRLINNLLDISRLEFEGYEKVDAILNIVEVVEEVTHASIDFARVKAIEVIFDTEEEELFIRGEQVLIERMILNLLSNAVKFTDTGGRIDVRIQKADAFVSIKVKDTGCGMRTSEMTNIFNRFYRCKNLFTRTEEGSGLGLYIVAKILEAHEGTVEVSSKRNEGTTFEIKLPLEKNSYSALHNQVQYNPIKIDVKVEMSDSY